MHFQLVFVLSTLLFGVPWASAATAPTSLEDAFNSALTKSETLKQSEERYYQSDQRVGQGIGGVLPNLSFQLTHQIQAQPQSEVAREFSPQNQTTANFQISQPLFRGLREYYGLSQLDSLRSAEDSAKQSTRLRLFQDVSSSYLTILSLEQDAKNLREQSELYDKRVGELEARAKRGESNQSEVLSAQSTQSSLMAEIRLQEGQLEVARENFHFLTGLPRDSSLTDPSMIAKLGGPQHLEKYVQRVEDRPDVKAALHNYEAAREAVSVAWGAHWPELSAVGNYYLRRPGFLQDVKWDIGLQLKVPLFEGGATQSKVREAISKRKEAELELEKTRRAALAEIRSLHQRLSARLDHMTRLKRSAELSRKNSQVVQRDYRRGLTRSIDVQLALTEFRVAQRSFDQARFTAQMDYLQLQAAAALVPVSEKEAR
jgi:outer membrane protein